MTKRDALMCLGRVALVLGLAGGVALGAGCGGKSGDGKTTSAGHSGGKAGVGAGDAASGDGASGKGSGGGDGGSVELPDGATVPIPEADASTPDVDAGGGGGSVSTGGTLTIPKDCPDPLPNQPPETLSCTGMYSDIAKKTLSSGVHEFLPAVQLWSDGAEKKRWVYLPEGEKIDVSDPDAWKFPIGTRFFKEFKWDGKRVETRLFWKVSQFYWARTAYQWNADETEATRTGGGIDLPMGSATYHIPSTTECDQCHKGRVEHALGFEAVLLGLPGATGVTLAKLEADGRLQGALPAKIEVGDDGTGHGAEALTWLHVNCGVSCHNDNPASQAYSTKLRLRLRVAEADGSDTSGVDAIQNTVGVDTVTGRWLGKKRITAGSPSKSWLYSLMSTRNATNMKDQMPPIASRVVPTEGAKLISDWISAM